MKQIAVADLLADLERVADELGHPPLTGEYDTYGEYSTSTVLDRFPGWAAALDAAGLDPDARPSTWTHADSEYRERVLCPSCGNRQHHSDPEAPFVCHECEARTTLWQARIAVAADDTSLCRLAAGPVVAGEVDPGHRARQLLWRLKPLHTKSGVNHPDARSVLYLPGDLRAAARLFVRENTAYVESVLASNGMPLKQNWTDEEYQVLVEQFHWLDLEGSA